MPEPISSFSPRSTSSDGELVCRDEPASTTGVPAGGAAPTGATPPPGAHAPSPAAAMLASEFQARSASPSPGDFASSSSGGAPGSSAEATTEPEAAWRPTVNGCTIVPDSIGSVFDFYAACKRHDLDYQTCGTSREDADARFRANMRESCGESAAPVLCRIAADAYYFGVRAGADSAYAESQVAACIEAPESTWSDAEEYSTAP